MKINKGLKLILMLLTIASFSFLGVYAASVSSEATVDIISFNLSYGDRTNIAYAVDVNGASPSDVEMLFWYEKPESVKDAADFTDSSYSVSYRDDGSVRYPCVFFSDGIAPKDSLKQVYAAAHIKGTEIYSDVERYSAVEYIYERLLTPGITDVQRNAYNSYIEFAGNMQLLLDHNVEDLPSDYVFLHFDGGVDEEGFSYGVYKIGSSVTVSSMAEGGASLLWVDQDGNSVGNGSQVEITVGSEHNVYRAVADLTVSAVGGEIEIAGGVAVIGAKATLTAPLYIDGDAGREYFEGWYSESGSNIGGAAHCEITITGSDVYTARYCTSAELDSFTLNDFASGEGNTALVGTNGGDTVSAAGGQLTYTSARSSTSVAATLLKTDYTGLAKSSSKLVSFKINLPTRDMEESGWGDEIPNEQFEDFFTHTGKTVLYKLSLLTGGDALIDLVIVVSVNAEGVVTGYNLALASDPEIKLLANDLALDKSVNLSFEIACSADGTAAESMGIYVDGAWAASTDGFTEHGGDVSYDPSGDLTFNFGSTDYTCGYVLLDDFLYYEINIED